MSKTQEGVIKFNLQFDEVDVVSAEMIAELAPWRERLFKLKLIGMDPLLYDGLGYGNISRRLKPGSDEFTITGTQTSHLASLTEQHYAIVTKFCITKNSLHAKGLTRPSSEALTHAAFYQASEEIHFVFHVHSATIWAQAKALDIPVTADDIAYGTAEMALEIEQYFKTGQVNSRNLVAMGGHKDGIIAFGETAEQAGQSILNILTQLQ